MMKNALKLAHLALLSACSGFGCGPSDNVIATRSRSGSGDAGRLAEVAGNGNGIPITVGGAGAGGVTNAAGARASSGGAGSRVMPTSSDSGIAGSAGGTIGVAAGGASASGGSDNAPLSAGGNGDEGWPLLTPTNGWVDSASNELGIQGALFADADSTSKIGMTSNFAGAQACIAGTAALVDMASPPCVTQMFTPPATDCYGHFWGASLNLNLNQPTMGGTPLPYDASALEGFAFEISGNTVPAPSSLRFQVHSAKGEVFCNALNIKLKIGVNNVFFRDLLSQCWVIQIPDLRPTAESAKSALTSIEWRVVTSASSRVPYDFCVSYIRALRN
jgi:hypothetical protein